MAMNSAATDGDRKVEAGLELHRQGRLDEAVALYSAVTAGDPAYPDARHLMGMVAFARGQLEPARQFIAEAIAIVPNDERFHLNLANVLRAMGRPEDAIAALDKALALRADYAEAWVNRALVLARLSRFDEALADLDRALALRPGVADIWFQRGSVLRELGRNDAALASYDKAIALSPGLADAFEQRGVLLGQLRRHEDALRSFDEALAANPANAKAHYNRGTALYELKRLPEAVAAYDSALALAPDNAEAHYNRGVALAELMRHDEALASYDRALTLTPDYELAHNNRGVALLALKRLDDALRAFDAALALKPDYADAFTNRGHAFAERRQYPEALAAYEAAFAINPSITDLPGAVLHTRMMVCAWQGLEELTRDVLAGVEAGKPVISPFAALALPCSRAQQRMIGMIHARAKITGSSEPLPARARSGDERIKLGYFSPDFRSHPVSFLSAGLFERHDRDRFEVYGFSYGPAASADPMRRRLERGFDRLINIQAMSDDAAAALSRELGIDIAIDLAGYTLDARIGIFARRAAPLQVQTLGYPGTLAVPFIDYIIADDVVIPPDHETDYTERVVILPHTFQVNDDRRVISAAPTRAQAGLDETAVVFCSFNNSFKLNPTTFDLWVDILRRVPNGVLWLLAESQAQIGNLKAYAEQRGIAPRRLVFAPRVPYADHLARCGLADLALDTAPFNGGATTSDALWAGLPVLTCPGETFAGRMAASLLRAVDLPELIAPAPDAYRDLAVALAQQPDRLRALRQKLAAHRTTKPLYDTALYTRHLEDAYAEMHRRHAAGLAPERIAVRPRP
ncbi:MAG: tetratricopeptide repeat protein [Rhodospirillaceae bacterium]|nr:tetratricopeptide repeat protein [Rhodospirillaceae bacterium]